MQKCFGSTEEEWIGGRLGVDISKEAAFELGLEKGI